MLTVICLYLLTMAIKYSARRRIRTFFIVSSEQFTEGKIFQKSDDIRYDILI